VRVEWREITLLPFAGTVFIPVKVYPPMKAEGYLQLSGLVLPNTVLHE
jgi:hypothetical protein